MKSLDKNGFSLMEMMVVVAILAILTYLFVGPGMRWYYQYELYKEGERLSYMITYAKSYAISNSVYTSICASGNSITIYNNYSYPNMPCSGGIIDSHTLSNNYLSYSSPQPISFNARGISTQNSNICIQSSAINTYYMICVSYASIRETSGTGSCPSNC